MDGMQLTIYERLKEIQAKVRDGAFGVDDDLDVESFREELDDLTADM